MSSPCKAAGNSPTANGGDIQHAGFSKRTIYRCSRKKQLLRRKEEKGKKEKKPGHTHQPRQTPNKAHRSRSAGDFLHDDNVCQITEIAAAIFFIDRDAEQPQVAQFLPKIGREQVVAIDRCRAGGDFSGGKGTHAVTDHLDGLAETKIEGRQIHGGLLSFVLVLQVHEGLHQRGAMVTVAIADCIDLRLGNGQGPAAFHHATVGFQPFAGGRRQKIGAVLNAENAGVGGYQGHGGVTRG
jgi:hypothetical protein